MNSDELANPYLVIQRFEDWGWGWWSAFSQALKYYRPYERDFRGDRRCNVYGDWVPGGKYPRDWRWRRLCVWARQWTKAKKDKRPCTTIQMHRFAPCQDEKCGRPLFLIRSHGDLIWHAHHEPPIADQLLDDFMEHGGTPSPSLPIHALGKLQLLCFGCHDKRHEGLLSRTQYRQWDGW